MRVDIVSVFPEYFDVLNLSLLGKAQAKGLVDVHTHNLRDWTHDVHHSVDDTPVGGGAGMVMKPAVWAECLDELLGCEPREMSDSNEVPTAESPSVEISAAKTSADKPSTAETSVTEASVAEIFSAKTSTAEASAVEIPISTTSVSKDPVSKDLISETPVSETSDIKPSETVLIFPNPSAPLFTQRDATELSHAQRLVFGCGRYEGYDARIPEYYRAQGVDVREYSIGDYVLNGGEVAVSVMLEAITRLLPGFMGNPDSIVEESYTGGNALLEHRQYTKPATWRGMEVPPVLLSGDHGKVDRFRRDEALTRTTEIRPDLIKKLDCRALDKADRKTLMSLGWEVSGDHPRRLPNI